MTPVGKDRVSLQQGSTLDQNKKKGRSDLLKSYAVALVAVAIAGAMLSAPLALANMDDDDETGVAGGGGWFIVKKNNVNYKDNFGMCLDNETLDNSSLVFHARELGLTLHAYEFSDVSVEDDDGDGNWSAHASGQAWSKGADWNFTLKVTDFGKGKMDTFMLEIEQVGDPNMVLTWSANGLGGGNIWVA